MDSKTDRGFKNRVYEVVREIPEGRVMTYGQIAALCGSPRAARIVGGIAHHGNLELPWHRVVKKDGSLAEGYPGGVQGHAEHLRAEGVKVEVDLRLDIKKLLWIPDKVL